MAVLQLRLTEVKCFAQTNCTVVVVTGTKQSLDRTVLLLWQTPCRALYRYYVT